VPDLLGSNFSISTKLLHEVNGYNEDFQAYWGEDGDLFVRVRNAGALIRGRKNFAVQFHLDHPRLEPKAEYQERYQALLKDRSYVRCLNGISNTTRIVAS
jgi:predicted glycosyltransferase involved in capsule biosynthesis